MSINDHSECSPAFYSSRPLHCSFSTLFLLMNYGLKIGTVNFLPCCPFIIADFFLAVAVQLFFCMFGRYRNLIVLSTLKDSYDLIFVMIKIKHNFHSPLLKPHLLPLQNLTSFTFARKLRDFKFMTFQRRLFPRQVYCKTVKRSSETCNKMFSLLRLAGKAFL